MTDKKNIKDALSVIHSRCSVRSFTGKPVSKDDLMTILKAAMAAPSAVNCQPWEFIVVTQRKILDKLADELPYGKMLSQVGIAIIVCAVPVKAYNQSLEYAIIDSSLASENILLATEAFGLGAVWVAIYPEENRMKDVRVILNIPENIIPLNVIPIGYPAGKSKPKDKFDEKNIRFLT